MNPVQMGQAEGAQEMNKFEQVYSIDHQMSLAGGGGWGLYTALGERGGSEAEGVLHSEVECIMGNAHMGQPPPRGQTH